MQAKLAVVVEHLSKKETKLLLPRRVVVNVLAGLILPAVLIGMAAEQLIQGEEQVRLDLREIQTHGAQEAKHMTEHVGVLVARLDDVDANVDNVSVSDDLLTHLGHENAKERMKTML